MGCFENLLTQTQKILKDNNFNNSMLIVGTGMLGKELQQLLPAATAWDREHDITKDSIIPQITELNPSMIINCAAYTAVDKAEEERELCYEINVTGVKNLKEAEKLLNIHII